MNTNSYKYLLLGAADFVPTFKLSSVLSVKCFIHMCVFMYVY